MEDKIGDDVIKYCFVIIRIDTMERKNNSIIFLMHKWSEDENARFSTTNSTCLQVTVQGDKPTTTCYARV